MKNLYKNIATFFMSLGLLCSLSACSNDEPNDSPFVDPKNPSESTILLYAVATNTLFGNFLEDQAEILEAAKDIDLNKNNVLVFVTGYQLNEETGRYSSSSSDITLLKLVRSGNGYDWLTIKEYEDTTAPLDPATVSEVVDYVFTNFVSHSKGIIFWSHSSGTNPYLTGRDLTTAAQEEQSSSMSSSMTASVPQAYSFGQDKLSPDEKYTEINIDELANALPDHFFDFIWFDSCYMGNIESVYQLRNKCDYYIGYPTEVWEWGCQYNLVLPHLTKRNPDILGAAEAFFKYYENRTSYNNATIGVTDMSKIELLADYCRQFLTTGTNVSSTYPYIEYTTTRQYRFYDLGDYVKDVAKLQGIEITDEEWQSVLDQCMPYRAGTERLLDGSYLPQQRYSALSTHVYNFSDTSDKELYYQSLDWYKSVFN